MPDRIYPDSELKAALNCLVAYVGTLALQSMRTDLSKWAADHYEALGHSLTAERSELLLDLRPLVMGAAANELDLSAVVARLETLGWSLTFLRRELG